MLLNFLFSALLFLMPLKAPTVVEPQSYIVFYAFKSGGMAFSNAQVNYPKEISQMSDIEKITEFLAKNQGVPNGDLVVTGVQKLPIK